MSYKDGMRKKIKLRNELNKEINSIKSKEPQLGSFGMNHGLSKLAELGRQLIVLDEEIAGGKKTPYHCDRKMNMKRNK